jgi:hypothetical protein
MTVSVENVSHIAPHYFMKRKGKEKNPPLVSPPTLGGGKS